MTFRRIIAAFALLVAAATQSQAAFVFTDSTAFLAGLNPGSYTEGFAVGTSGATSASFSSNGFAYTITAPGPNSQQLYFSGGGPSGAFVATNTAQDSLLFTFTSGNVTAVGGNFFTTDLEDNFLGRSLTITTNDGTTQTYTTAGINDFRGFYANPGDFITTISLDGDPVAPFAFASADNLVVGTYIVTTVDPSAVPAPATALLALAAPLLGLGVRRFRK
jgi:hypothetical protein